MYRGFVLPKHRLAVRKALERELAIFSLFSQKWAEENLIPAPLQRIEEVHPLYEFFANPSDLQLTIKGLKYLSDDRKTSVIRNLKNDRIEEHVKAAIRNIQTFAVIKYKNQKAEFEPRPHGTLKRPDILVPLGETECYLEVFSVREREKYTEEKLVVNELHARINLLGDNPFVIGAEKINPLKIRDLEFLWSSLQREIWINRARTGTFEKVVEDRKGHPLIKFEFTRREDGNKGFWGYYTEGRTGSDANRLKLKILNKVRELQFPSQESINGYVLYLEDWWISPKDVEEALMGQEIVYFREGASKAKLGRKDNGLINHSVGREPLLKWVDFFIIASHPRDLQNLEGYKVFYNTDRKKVTEGIIKTQLIK